MKRQIEEAILVSLNDAAKMTSLSRTMINKYREQGQLSQGDHYGRQAGSVFLRTGGHLAWIDDHIANGRLQK